MLIRLLCSILRTITPCHKAEFHEVERGTQESFYGNPLFVLLGSFEDFGSRDECNNLAKAFDNP